MKVISPTMHAIMDYVIGAVMLIFANSFASDRAANVLQVIGVLILLQAMMTRWRPALFRVMPIRLHLRMDALIGLILLISPWLFGFAGDTARSWAPHVIFGLIIFGQAMMTAGDPVVDRMVGTSPTARDDQPRRAA